MITPQPVLVGVAAYAEKQALAAAVTADPFDGEERLTAYRQATEALAALGYAAHKRDNCNYGRTIWINAARRTLVKFPYTLEPSTPPRRAVPTVDLPHGFVRQPLCDTSKEAVEAALAEVGNHFDHFDHTNYAEWGRDAHKGNVGLLDGRAVVFDW